MTKNLFKWLMNLGLIKLDIFSNYYKDIYFIYKYILLFKFYLIILFIILIKFKEIILKLFNTNINKNILDKKWKQKKKKKRKIKIIIFLNY